MDVSIIIVNYNTRKLLSACLESIRAQTQGIAYEVIVSDNGSTDGSLEVLARDFPWVRVVANGANLGFGTANNRGAALATGTYLFFLNSDTLLLNNAVGEFLKEAQALKGRFGVLGCVLKNAQLGQANSLGFFPSYGRALGDKVGNFLELYKAGWIIRFSGRLEVDFVTGADMFMERRVFEEIRGFDEAFFLYFEETDLQRRLRARGFRNYLVEGPGVQHLEGGSGKAKMGSRILQEKSMYQYFAKNRGAGPALWAFFLAYSLLSLASLPRYSLGEAWVYLRHLIIVQPRLLKGLARARA